MYLCIVINTTKQIKTNNIMKNLITTIETIGRSKTTIITTSKLSGGTITRVMIQWSNGTSEIEFRKINNK